jgi:CheY-like chemotaxis protein
MQESGRRRALVVDDSAISRMIAAAMLGRREFEVIEAADAESALRQLQDECFDLVLLDIHMPGMSGNELCQVMRNDLGMVDLPIFAYTSHAQVTDVALMRLAGFNELLIKPVSVWALDQAIDHSLQH